MSYRSATPNRPPYGTPLYFGTDDPLDTAASGVKLLGMVAAVMVGGVVLLGMASDKPKRNGSRRR